MHDPSASTLPTATAPRRILRLGLAAWGLGLCLAAGAQTAPASTNAQQRLQQELAACANGSSHQDPATCRREAINAHAAAGKGQLTTPQEASHPETQRCNRVPVAQQAECLARMQEGHTQGSVEGGGILREHTTIMPAPAAPPQ